MILANYTQENRNCYKQWGMSYTNPLVNFKPQVLNNFYMPNTLQAGRDLSAFNNGYNTSYAWHPALKTGGLGSVLNVNGSGGIDGLALAVRLAAANISGSGDLTAIGGLIVQLVAALTANGNITDAQLNAFLQAVASISGSGNITDADLEGFGAIVASLIGSGAASGSTLTALGELAAALNVTGTGLTTANVGQAVWSALAAVNNLAGTMGEKLNDAGAAGNPWAALLASNNDPNTFGALLQAMNNLVDELHRIEGLKAGEPMTVTQSTRVAGDIELEITGDGTTTTTVTRL